MDTCASILDVVLISYLKPNLGYWGLFVAYRDSSVTGGGSSPGPQTEFSISVVHISP